MCRNIIIGLLSLVILLGAGCGILAVRYNRLADRASEQAQRIGQLAGDVSGYRERIEGIRAELENEQQRAGKLAERIANVTAENNWLANEIARIGSGITEGRGSVERIAESEKRTAEKYDELEDYLNQFR